MALQAGYVVNLEAGGVFRAERSLWSASGVVFGRNQSWPFVAPSPGHNCVFVMSLLNMACSDVDEKF